MTTTGTSAGATPRARSWMAIAWSCSMRNPLTAAPSRPKLCLGSMAMLG